MVRGFRILHQNNPTGEQTKPGIGMKAILLRGRSSQELLTPLIVCSTEWGLVLGWGFEKRSLSSAQ